MIYFCDVLISFQDATYSDTTLARIESFSYIVHFLNIQERKYFLYSTNKQHIYHEYE